MKAAFITYAEPITVEGMNLGGYGSGQYHTHDKYELMFCCQGIVNIDSGGNMVKVSAPFLALHRPYCIHYMIREENCIYERAKIYFDDNALQGVDSRLINPSDIFTKNLRIISLTDEQAKRLRRLFELILPREQKHLRLFLLCSILQEIRQIAQAETDTADPSKKHLYINEIVRYIGEHYQQPLTAEEIAAQFFVSVPKLNRDFRTHTQKSLREFLIHVRLQHAAKFLLNGYSVRDTTHLAGFSSETHFIRTFKAYYHTTPHQYAKKQQFVK